MPELKKEQYEAVMHDEGNVLVSASAGSGKTFVMIERLIRLISEGKAKVKEILAVTFTEAAAADMKEKLKKALIKKINEGDSSLADELAEVSVADVSTLHAFCARLLRRYFFAAGVSPDFQIADEDKASELKRECIDRVFRELYAEKDAGFYKLTERYRKKRSDARLKETVLSLYAFCEAEKNPSSITEKAEKLCEDGALGQILAEYKRYLDKDAALAADDAIRALKGFRETGNEKGIKFAETLVYDLERVLNSADIYVYKEYEGYPLTAVFGRGLKEKDAESKALAIGARDRFKKIVARVYKHLTDRETDLNRQKELLSHTRALAALIKRFSEEYAEEKREENLLDFGDLEHFTLTALKDESVKKSVRDKYKYVFVDEYQDVNGVQEEIISSVSDGNLFMVGDVKQSIYGFRGCRPEIFDGKRRAMISRGEKTVLLNHNFRSALAVTDCVNEIFSYSMTEESSGTDYKNTSALIPGGIFPAEKTGRAELHLLLTEKKRRSEKERPRVYDVAEEARKAETEEIPPIASLVTEIIRRERGKTFYDVKEGRDRYIGYSDIAVLTRNKSNGYVEGLVTGLIRHGIPVASEVKQNVCDYPEIKTLINALKLIDCFYQDVPLVSVLLSPIGGFTEEELAAVALFYADETGKDGKKYGFSRAFSYYAEKGEGVLKEKAVEFKKYFDELRFAADFLGAGGALFKMTENCGYENYLLATPCGEEKAKRLHGFMAAASAGGKTYTIKEFLKRTETARDAFSVASGGEENAVRVMTVHASKGLEFPVAIVCGLERKSNTEEEREEILADRDLGLATRCFDDESRTVSETPLRGLMREKMRETRVKEELRLFYVATTRAQYSLHLTFEGKEDGRKEVFRGAEKFLDYVPFSIPVTEWNAEDFLYTDMTAERRKVLIGRADEQAAEEMKRAFSFRYPFAAETALPLKGTVTAAAESFSEKEHYVHRLFDETDVPDREKGITAHKILELYDFFGADFSSQIKEMTKEGKIAEEKLSGLSLERIEKAIKSGAFGSLSGYSLYREQPFLVNAPANMLFSTDSAENVLLQGVIDLLAIKDGRATIIDYKYSSLNGESAKRRYKKQLALYAYAAEKILGVKVERKILLNLFSGEMTEV